MRILTPDIFAAAYLLSHGAACVDLLVDRTAGRPMATFALEGSEDLQAHFEIYALGHATASVKDLRENVGWLRRRRTKAFRTPRNNPSPRPVPLTAEEADGDVELDGEDGDDDPHAEGDAG